MEAIAARVRCSNSAVSNTLSIFKEMCSVDDETTFWYFLLPEIECWLGLV